MQIPPESVIAAWPEPNYFDPVTRGPENVIINIFLYSILICCIAIRVFSRIHLKRIFGVHDVFILLAMVPTTTFFAISVLADAHFLWIRHVYDIPQAQASTGLKMVLSAQLMFAAACTLTKLSMLIFVRRIFASLIWRRITLSAITFIAVQGSVFCITVIFQCRPPQDYWKLSRDPQPNCVNQRSSLLAAGIINTVTDFLVVLLPIRTIWSLQLRDRESLLLMPLFGFGFISCGAGIARTYYLFKVSQTWDQTWASYPVWVTGAIELYVGVICTSIPASRPFFSTYLPQIFGSVSSLDPKASSSRRPSQERTGNEVAICAEGNDGDEGDEELLDLEKALSLQPDGGFLSPSSSKGDGKASHEDSNFIRITQTVDVSGNA